MAKKQEYYYGLGRRKEATAQVRLYGGKGNITINEKPLEEYFDGSSERIHRLQTPLRLLDKESDFDITVKVKGGGKSGQVDAISLGIANALTEVNEDFRSNLKRAGLLERDDREKERKKPGLKGARKAPQFTKR